jgi:hypothetical protein
MGKGETVSMGFGVVVCGDHHGDVAKGRRRVVLKLARQQVHRRGARAPLFSRRLRLKSRSKVNDSAHKSAFLTNQAIETWKLNASVVPISIDRSAHEIIKRARGNMSTILREKKNLPPQAK